MATRSTISIEGMTPIVYKHWDGYPKAMIPWLTEFNKTFTKKRGDDPSYKFAQLLRSSVMEADKYQLDNDKFTGWGVIESFQDLGQEYNYLLKTDGSIVYTEINVNPQTNRKVK